MKIELPTFTFRMYRIHKINNNSIQNKTKQNTSFLNSLKSPLKGSFKVTAVLEMLVVIASESYAIHTRKPGTGSRL